MTVTIAPVCTCGHSYADHAAGASSMCGKCKCASYTPFVDPVPLTATKAKALLDTALAKPEPTFPFSFRDRYEVAYTLLVWELLKALQYEEPDDMMPQDLVLKAMTKAAGELT